MPLPSRSHSYLAIEPPPCAVEPAPLNVTDVFGSTGLGVAVKAAFGGPPLPTVTDLEADAMSTVASPSRPSVTVMLIVRAPGVAKVVWTVLPVAGVPARSQMTVSMSLSSSVDVSVNV